MEISRMNPNCFIAGVLAFLACSVQAASANEVDTVTVATSEFEPTIELKDIESKPEPAAIVNHYAIVYRWHVWRHDRSCIKRNEYKVEDTESEVLRKCDIHKVESYRYAKVMVSFGGIRVLHEYPCTPCHLHGVHWDESDNDVPSGGGVDIFDLDQELNRHGHEIGTFSQSRVSAMFAAHKFPTSQQPSEIENSMSFLNAYVQSSNPPERITAFNVKQTK